MASLLGQTNSFLIVMSAKGKIVRWLGDEIRVSDVHSLPVDEVDQDGSRIDLGEAIVCQTPSPLSPLDSLSFDTTGSLISICASGNCSIHTAEPWLELVNGPAIDLVWSLDGLRCAVMVQRLGIAILERATFKVKHRIHTTHFIDAIFGGKWLGLSSGGIMHFHDWKGVPLLNFKITAEHLFWSPSGDLLAIASRSVLTMLEVINVPCSVGSGQHDDVTTVLKVLYTLKDQVRSATWINRYFVYSTSSKQIKACVGAELTTLCRSNHLMILLGYLVDPLRIYLVEPLKRNFYLLAFPIDLSQLLRNVIKSVEDLRVTKRRKTDSDTRKAALTTSLEQNKKQITLARRELCLVKCIQGAFRAACQKGKNISAVSRDKWRGYKDSQLMVIIENVVADRAQKALNETDMSDLYQILNNHHRQFSSEFETLSLEAHNFKLELNEISEECISLSNEENVLQEKLDKLGPAKDIVPGTWADIVAGRFGV